MRVRSLVVSFLACFSAMATTTSVARAEVHAAAGQDASSAIPLQEKARVQFSQDKWLAWIEPARCDANGNVFVVPVPKADTSIDPHVSGGPGAILRLSTEDEDDRRELKPAGLPAFTGEAAAIRVVAITVDADGNLYALLWIPRDEVGAFFIVSYDDKARYRSRVEVDPEEMVVGAFEVFESGDFLLHGVRRVPEGEPRLAVMPREGGAVTDVFGVFNDPTLDPAAPARPAHMARGGDGLVYIIPRSEPSVYAVEPTAQSREVLVLPAVPENLRLVGLKGAGDRLALVYFEDRPSGEGGSRFWVNVYDVTLGERAASYGPLPSPPLCYQNARGQDRFTLVDAGFLVTYGP